MSISNIAIRMEGGIGDHLCAIRFLPAIRELYPDCKFYGFSDTENNNTPKNIIETFWPSLFEEITVIPNKKQKPYIIKSQFGTENYIGAFENIPDAYRAKIINDYDKYYDLHIDGLKWLTYDFNWSKYFFRFLPIEIDIGMPNRQSNHLCVSLYSDANPGNRLDKQYVYDLLFSLSKNYSITILATKNNYAFYESCEKFATIVCYEIIDVVKTIQNSCAFLCIDSGLKFLGYSVETPTFNFLSQIKEYGNLPIHQHIRWNPYIWSVLPLHHEIGHTTQLLQNSIKYKTNLLPVNNVNINNLLIYRIY